MYSFLLVLSLLFMTGQENKINNLESSHKLKSKYMYELAINQSKQGAHSTFLETRKKFVDVLGKEDATLNEGKWQPFFTVDPALNLDNILVGMTHWNSMEGFGEAAARLLPQQEAREYFSSFNPLAYALLQTVDGQAFDVETIKSKGMVVEFAIRKSTEENAFDAPRDTFFNSLENYEGYKFAREFYVYKLNEQSIPTLAEDTQAVIIVWEDAEKFQAAAGPIFASIEYNSFASKIEVETYFATLPVM